MPDVEREAIREAVDTAVHYGFDWGDDACYVTPEQLRHILSDALIAVLCDAR